VGRCAGGWGLRRVDKSALRRVGRWVGGQVGGCASRWQVRCVVWWKVVMPDFWC